MFSFQSYNQMKGMQVNLVEVIRSLKLYYVQMRQHRKYLASERFEKKEKLSAAEVDLENI